MRFVAGAGALVALGLAAFACASPSNRSTELDAGASGQTLPVASIKPDEPVVETDASVDAQVSSPAACPDDMALVDGLFCPGLAYRCLKRSKGQGHGCPEYSRGEVCLGQQDRRRYCIDKHEWPNRVGEQPKVYVSWFEAKALCEGAGKRLCRRSEWILACEGPKRLPYPWGFVRQPSPCNIDRPVVEADINAIADERTRADEIARLWQADPIGSHPNCTSSFGVYDLSGNVDEWTDNQADDPTTDQVSTLNGGYWGPVRNTCRLTTKSHGPTFTFYQVGFRCCSDTHDGVKVDPPKPFREEPPKRVGESPEGE